MARRTASSSLRGREGRQPGRGSRLTYDPYQHAEELGLKVEHQRLRTANGLYIPEQRLVILSTGLKQRIERSVLAHEIAHHLHNDRAVDSLWTIRQERRANRTAANLLIGPDDLRDAQRASPDPGRWALDLHVTTPILLAYLETEAA